jgi:hypothetical protein
LEPGYSLPYGQIYNISKFELKTLKAYIEANLFYGVIQQSLLPAVAPILFTKKKNWGLKLCVDYHVLNKATVENCYLFAVISEMLDCMREAKIFTKLDLHSAYHLICIKEDDEY